MDLFRVGARSATEIAHLIGEAIKALGAATLNQKQIQEEIGFFYLSQAKNAQKYQIGTDPYLCYGKDRREILVTIIEHFGLIYDPELNTFRYPRKTSNQEDKYWYVFYYFDPALRDIQVGLLTFSLPHTVRFTHYFSGQEVPHSSWAGRFSHNSPYLYLDLYDDATKRLRVLHTYSVGMMSLWQPVYQGVFSSFTSDGVPMVGLAVIDRVASKEEAMAIIRSGKYPTLISACIKKGALAPRQSIAASVEHLLPDLAYEFIVGTYTFIYKDGDLLKRATLDLELSQDASLLLNSGATYEGYFKLREYSSLEVYMRERNDRGRTFGSRVVIICKVHRTEPEHRAFSSLIVGDNSRTIPEAFPALFYAEGVFKSEAQEQNFIDTYFNQYGVNIKAQDYYQLRGLLDRCRK